MTRCSISGVPGARAGLVSPSRRVAETRWAVIISGASGGEKYAEQMRDVARRPAVGAGRSLRLQGRARADVRGRDGQDRREAATAENVRKLFAEIKKTGGEGRLRARRAARPRHLRRRRRQVQPGRARPDREGLDRPARRAPGPRRASSTPPKRAFRSSTSLTAKGRVVITATDSAAQKYATVFPEYFVKAMKRSVDRPRQERPHLDLRSVRRRQRRGEAALRAARPADHRTRAARRQRRRQGPGSDAPRAPTAASRASPTSMPKTAAETANPELAALVRRRRALETAGRRALS